MSNVLVQMFDYWADEARKGNVLYAGVAAALVKDQIAIHHEGHRGFETNCRKAAKQLKLAFDGVLSQRHLAPRNYSLGANCVEYPLSNGISWDFLAWLVEAEMRRVRLNAPSPLHVAFSIPDEIDPNRVDFFNNVCRPLLPLIGAVEDVAATGGRYNPFFTMSGVTLAARSGEPVPRLRAPEEIRRTMECWLHGTKPIVITLREVAGYAAQRNSNIDAWLIFARDLKRVGEEVIFVRDTARANDAVPGFATCPQASFDVQYRMALYELAKANFCVQNGPGTLFWFSDVPYGFFVNIGPDDTTDADWWRKNHGLEPGEQWPWSLETQKLFWQPDTYENISRAWEQLNV